MRVPVGPYTVGLRHIPVLGILAHLAVISIIALFWLLFPIDTGPRLLATVVLLWAILDVEKK